MADSVSVLESRIAALEARVSSVGRVGGIGPRANFSSGSCTNNCTAACTIGCTSGCTGGCISELQDAAAIAERPAASLDALSTFERLAVR